MPFLTPEPIDAAAILAEVSDPARGGTALFVGSVRNHHRDRAVVRLEYSAYPAMAEREAAAILAEARERWPALVATRHRTGMLEPGEVAIVVAAAAAHREAAFTACRWVVDELKRRVPIWKREHLADGTVEWVDPQAAGEDPP